MSGNRLEDRFRLNARAKGGALLPYLTAGFPDIATTGELIRRADALGVTAIELGIPYSDSIADGPIIQDSFHSVLEHGPVLNDTLELVRRIRPSVRCGLIAMVSCSIVHRVGLDLFMDRVAAAGFDGVILPDVPVEESAPHVSAADRAGLCQIGLVAPTTSDSRREAIARGSRGFIYQIAARGTTGEREALAASLADHVARLRAFSDLPVCVGFGISNADQVRAVLRFCDGAIVGSAVIRRIAEALRSRLSRKGLIESVARFLSHLMSGLTPRDNNGA